MMQNNSRIIYSIKNPVSNQVIYVGQTKDMDQRVLSHRNSHNDFLKAEIKSILDRGLKPVFETLEECAPAVTNERERYWIKKHLSDGYSLHNGVSQVGRPKQATSAKLIRMPDELIEKLEGSAKKEGMKFQAYIIHLLTKSVK